MVTAPELDGPFTMAEVWAAIIASSAEKAPSPDGFTDQFSRSCWHIIKDEIMAVFQKFYHMAGRNFSDINTALIALLPKRNEASEIGHYRPISLIHSVAKLIPKVLALRLSAALDGVISPAQTAFQRGKCIHDSFSTSRAASECCTQRKSRLCFSNWTSPEPSTPSLGRI